MRRFSFGGGTGTELTHHDSTSVEWVPVVRKADPQSAAVDIMHIGPGGVLGRHPAGPPQLFLVVAGSGWVCTGDQKPEPIGSGEAVLWEPGEVHESGSHDGMTVVIVQLGGLTEEELLHA